MIDHLPRLGAAMLLCAVLAGCKVGLYSNLNEQEANEMLAALTAQSLSASKEREASPSRSFDADSDCAVKAASISFASCSFRFE